MLARLRSRVGSAPPNLAHPVPGPIDGVPVPVSSLVDTDDLIGSFARNASAAGATVHQFTSDGVAAFVAALVERLGVRRAVASKQREAWPFVEQLGAAGVDVGPFDRESSTIADLGVTVASAGLATTGSVVQRSDQVGGRTASLLPTRHLCIVPASRIVASTSDVLRSLPAAGLPSNVVFVTGPSKSGDIEQIIVTGVHGPIAVELCVVLDI